MQPCSRPCLSLSGVGLPWSLSMPFFCGDPCACPSTHFTSDGHGHACQPTLVMVCVAALADADAGLLPPRAQVVLPVHMRVGILYLPSHFVGHCVSRCWVVSLPLNPVPDHQAHRSRRGTPLVYKRFIPLPLQNFISTLLLDMTQHALSPRCQIQCSRHHGQIQCHAVSWHMSARYSALVRKAAPQSHVNPAMVSQSVPKSYGGHNMASSKVCPREICDLFPTLVLTLTSPLAISGAPLRLGIASIGFMAEVVPPKRSALAAYPVVLFYASIAWIIIIRSSP